MRTEWIERESLRKNQYEIKLEMKNSKIETKNVGEKKKKYKWLKNSLKMFNTLSQQEEVQIKSILRFYLLPVSMGNVR